MGYSWITSIFDLFKRLKWMHDVYYYRVLQRQGIRPIVGKTYHVMKQYIVRASREVMRMLMFQPHSYEWVSIG